MVGLEFIEWDFSQAFIWERVRMETFGEIKEKRREDKSCELEYRPPPLEVH